jgi:hypothetical protein
VHDRKLFRWLSKIFLTRLAFVSLGSLVGGMMLVAAITALVPASSRAQQLWFSPGDDLEVRGVVSHPDFQQLFVPGAAWQTGLAQVNVMQVRPPWLLRMPEDAVQRVTKFLKQHKIALSAPLGVVSTETCGQGVEGLGSAREQIFYPREIKKRGIDLDYIVMDEPLFYGHDYTGKNACNFSIEAVAKSVTSNVKMIRTYYPNARFVLVEPPQSLPGGVEELSRFLDAYKAGLNELPVAVRFDIAWGQSDKWHREWHHDLPGFVQMLKARGIGYSIIYNAGHVNGRIPNTDASWIASAKANVADWQATIRVKPAQAVIQTWSPNPIRILPESDPTTMTGYLKWFIEHTRAGRPQR